MLDILLNLVLFFSGIAVGKARSTNSDITSQTSYMQDLIDEAYEKRDAMKTQWLNAEENAETWKRRYFSILEDLEEEEDEEVGS